MNKPALITLLLLIFFINQINAQPAGPIDTVFRSSIQNFEKYFIKYYKPNKRQVNHLCENSCVFIRFKILKGGKISDLAFSKDIPVGGLVDGLVFSRNSPPVIIDALTRALKRSETHLTFPEELQSDDRMYVLPFIYYYNNGCYAERKTENKKLGTSDTTYKPADEEQFGKAILNILNYTDKKFNTLHCTILNPIKVGKKNAKAFF